MEQHIYGVTNETLQEKKKGFFLTLIMVPTILVIIALVLLMSRPKASLLDIKSFTIIMAIFIVILIIGQFLSQKALLKKLSEMKLIVRIN